MKQTSVHSSGLFRRPPAANTVQVSFGNNNNLRETPFLNGFFMSLIGARRSGKSTLMKELLRKDLKNRFREEDVFIFCPSIDLNDDFAELNKAHKYPVPDQAIIYAILEEQEHNIKTYGKDRTPEILIIFDDCADNKIIQFGGAIDKLAVRGRHYKICVIVSSQRMSALSRTARLNSDYFLVFSPYNLSETEQMLEQYVLKQDRKKYMKAFQEYWDEPFVFVLVDNSERSQKKKLKLGFNEVLTQRKIEELSFGDHLQH